MMNLIWDMLNLGYQLDIQVKPQKKVGTEFCFIREYYGASEEDLKFFSIETATEAKVPV
jgi:hypothetical protein